MKLLKRMSPAPALAGCLVALLVLVWQWQAAPAPTDAPPSAAAPLRRVTLLTSFSLQDSARYQQALAPLAYTEGIQVVIRAVGGDFADHVYVATPGFDAPDIAVFAQPGLFRDMVAAGLVQPLPADLAQGVARDFPAFLDPLLRQGDRHYGLWARVAIKSLVWYRNALFAKHGWQPPSTDEELAALERQIMRQGLVPWCIGVAARGASGWVGTDWVEEFMLRDAGPELYDRWVALELPFSSPPVREAFMRWEHLVRTPGMTAGGPQQVLATYVEEAARQFASDPATCVMMRNSEWVTSAFPDGVRIGPGEAVDFFLLPGHRADERPLLVAGDVAAPLNQRPETLAVLRYMASAEFGRRRAAAGAYLSGHKDVQPQAYMDPLASRLALAWRQATLMRMDASDLMPAAVGTAAFWTAMVDHLKGASVQAVTSRIDAAWAQAQAQQRPASAPAPAAGASR